MIESNAVRRVRFTLIGGGVGILAVQLYVRVMSAEFQYGSPMLERPILLFVGVSIGLALFHAGISAVLVRHELSPNLVAAVFALGLAMRLVFSGTNPILEDDYYRYLWDGAVTAHAMNPYAAVPAEALHHPKLAELAAGSGNVLERVNHPSLATIYPPIAQAAFTVAHMIRPWSLDAWRAVLLVIDAGIFALLVMLLRAAGLPTGSSVLYWWHPLGVTLTANAAHMDVIAVFFVLLGLLCAVHQRTLAAAISFALAIGTKLWPVLLLPVVIRNIDATRQRKVAATILGSSIVLLALAPMIAGSSGLTAYAGSWEMNDALFMVVLGLARNFVGDIDTAQLAARMIVAAILAGVAVRLARDSAAHTRDLYDRLAILAAVLFMLLPAQFPWYFLWVLPFVSLAPRPSLVALGVMLPLYYLKFYYAALGDVNFFHTRVVWLEYAPCLILAAIEFARSLSRNQNHA